VKVLNKFAYKSDSVKRGVAKAIRINVTTERRAEKMNIREKSSESKCRFVTPLRPVNRRNP